MTSYRIYRHFMGFKTSALLWSCLTCWLATPIALQAQLYIASGAIVHLSNSPTVTLDRTNLDNQGTLTATTGTIRFTGSGSQTMRSGGATIGTLVLDKSAGSVSLTDDAQVSSALTFSTGGHLDMEAYDLTLGSAATCSGYSAAKHVVTGAGKMTKTALGTTGFTFPVGAAINTYNPLTIIQNGTSDNISVRCLTSPLANGSTGTALTADAVNAAWEVTEDTDGGSSLSATAQWAGTDELGSFERTDCGIARFNTGTDWDLPPADMGASTGSDPYLRTRSALTPGMWAVMDEAFMNRILVSARIMLQGPYSTTNHNMNDNLRSLAAFPTTTPGGYGASKFSHSGWQPSGGYSISSSILSVTGDDAIVDWVFLWLKDPSSTSTNLQTRVALLQKDGDVVELNGVDPVKMPGNATRNYILGIGHRNHLSVRTPNGSGINFSENITTSYDFTTANSQAYGSNPMKLVDASPTAVYALWGGNANGNTTVRVTGPASINDYSAILTALGTSTILSNTYNEADVNLDGTVRATGPTTINDYSRLLNYLGTSSIITEQN